MLNKILKTLFCVLFCSNLSAQWSIGGKAGMNFSNLYGGEKAKYMKQRIGFNIGAVSDYCINDRFSLLGELLLAQYAVKYDNVLSNLDNLSSGSQLKSINNASIHSYYIDVPILVKFRPFKQVKGLNMEFGIQTGFFLKERINDGKQTYKQTDLYERKVVNCSFVCGLAFEIPANCYFDARYVRGVSDEYKQYSGMKKHAIQLSLGYLFRL